MKRAFLYSALIIICCGTNVRGAATIWAVSSYTILRNDDGAWQIVSLPDSVSGRYWKIWGSASNNVYFTGQWGGGGNQLLHYDGAGWRILTIPCGPPCYSFNDIDGTGANDIYVVGGWGDEFSAYGYMYHFDGSTWSVSSQQPPPLTLTDLWADPSGGCYVIGYAFNHLDHREDFAVYRYLPSGQWIHEYPRSGDDYFEYYDISGYGEDLVNVTGMINANYEMSGNVIHSKSAGQWDRLGREDSCGNYYVQYPHCPIWPTAWHGVWCASASDTWSCGPNGSVLHWTASGYTEFSTPTAATLNAIWGASNADVYAVGDGGAIVHYDGTAWSLMQSGTTANLYDIYGTPSPVTGAVMVPSVSLALNANYPNPFNPSTTIGYSIPARGRVTLRVYDAAGKLVKRLLDEEESAGAHSILWNGLDDRGRAVASGAYFCRIEFGKASLSRKILLVR